MTGLFVNRQVEEKECKNVESSMKKTINRKELLIKQRRTWKINPATRIIEDGKAYKRSAIKQAVREEIDQAILDLKNRKWESGN